MKQVIVGVDSHRERIVDTPKPLENGQVWRTADGSRITIVGSIADSSDFWADISGPQRDKSGPINLVDEAPDTSESDVDELARSLFRDG